MLTKYFMEVKLQKKTLFANIFLKKYKKNKKQSFFKHVLYS
jgi:hypothetical protein